MIDQKMIRVQKHPLADLWIYNYTEICQFARCWNSVTMQCRGLILDGSGNVVARPFQKFFNYEELQPSDIPTDLPFEIFEKMDGSLGILYWIGDEPFITTRGSFSSDQAIHASALVNKRFRELRISKRDLIPNATYLFEIIYPENRIVVDYGNEDNLYLLAVVDNESGKDYRRIPSIGFPVVKRYSIGEKSFSQLQEMNINNAEGFVLRYDNGFRLKIKFEDYKRLHKVISGLSNSVVWEHLLNDTIDELVKIVPDELYTWLSETIGTLTCKFTEIEMLCIKEYKPFENRRDAAEYYKTKTYPHILFKILDGKDYTKDIWKLVKPKFEKAIIGGTNE